MSIKKIFSAITSVVMMFSITLPDLAQNGSAIAIGSKDTSAFMENEPVLVADSSLGSYIVNAMNSEDVMEAGEQESDVQYSGDYGIEDVTYDPDTNTLTLTTWQAQSCTAVVGFYSDDGKQMYTSEKVDISESSENTSFSPDKSKLPGSFLVKAYLINDQLMPLSNSYVYNKMTKEMQEILAKTVNDFDPSLVVQIDETDDTNNFYVLNENTKLIDSSSDTNTLVSADCETGTYVFANIDDSMRGLAAGDIFSAATDEGVIAAEVITITIENDTATIVGTSDEEDLFQFIKINTSEMDQSLLNGYTLDMSEADESVSLSDKSFDETPIPEDESETTSEAEPFNTSEKLTPSTVDILSDEQASVGLKAEPTFTIAEKKVGASGNGFSAKINLVVSMPIEIKAEFYSSMGYASFELKSGYAIKAKGSASIGGELKIKLGQIDFPIAGVFHLALVPRFVVKGSVEVSLTYQKSFSAGFKWDTDTWQLSKCDGLKLKVEDKLELDLEASFFIGLELDFKGYIISIKTCSLSFPLDVGVRVKATLPVAFLKVSDTNGLEKGEKVEGAFLHIAEGSTEEYPDTLYNCDAFVEIDVDFQIKLSGELKIADYDWNPLKDKMKIKADIFEITLGLGKFYLVVYHDSETGELKVGFGSWPNLAGEDFILYKTTVKVYDNDYKPLSGALVNGDTTDENGEVTYYLSPGVYKFICKNNERERSVCIRIINRSITLPVYMLDVLTKPINGGGDDPDDPEAQGSLKYLTWKENDEGGITITGCDHSSVKIAIPREIDGKPVTSIGNQAFYNCTDLTDITIPDSVTSIGNQAFDNCTSLTDIIIPDSVMSIGNSAFKYCTSLKSITIPDGVTEISESAFDECSSLKDITIPDSVTSIGVSAFSGCTNLTDITIPDGVTSIGGDTFYYCTSLTSITMPDSVTSIGNQAFYNCTSLTDITIPNGVTSIGDCAFDACSSLKDIIIPDSVTSIGVYAFAGCTSLTDITISDRVTSIGGGAFQGCTSLTDIIIPDSVTSIGNGIFRDCTNLTDITMPDKMTSIGAGAFHGCTNLTDITIPDGVTSIGGDTFYYCTSLTSITIPDSVTSIGDSAFNYCTSLTSITIPDSVTSIGEYAFTLCKSLTNITIGNSVTSIGDFAFQVCASLTDITIPNSLTSIPEGAFYNCTNLITITIPDSVTSIGLGAFQGCTSLTDITIPGGVTSIEGVTFRGCESLTSINIPDSVTSIGGGAFQGCTSLIDITIPDSVTSIENYVFYYCKNLTDITIPESMTSIGSNALGSCSSITSITIPGSVTSIGDSAFIYCGSLESITILNPDCEIYDSKRTINNGIVNDDFCFNGTICGYANSTAQAYAEKYGRNFVSLGAAPAVSTALSYKPATIAAAGDVECTFTQEVAEPDIYNFYVFADENAADLLAADNLLYMTQVEVTADTLTVEIPYILGGDFPDKAELLVRFEAIDPGLVFDDTSEEDTVSLLDYTGSAADITIPAKVSGKRVTSIADGAFNGCTSLVSVTVPESVTSIGAGAFAECENLSSVTIQNPDCEIFDSAYTICNGYDSENGEVYFNGTICGYAGSTAQAYAEKYGYKFTAIGDKLLFGDFNGDGFIDSADASLILVMNADGEELTSEQISLGDINGDGLVDPVDASLILAYNAYVAGSGTLSLSDWFGSLNAA